MLRYLVVLAVGCMLLASAWAAALGAWARQVPWRRLGMAAWIAGVFIALACAFTAQRGNWGWPVLIITAAVALLILYAPPPVRRAAPVAMALLGVAGIVLTMSDRFQDASEAAWPVKAAPEASAPQASSSGVAGLPAGMTGRADAWRVVLLIQSVALLAAGLYLLWAQNRRAVPARGGPEAPLGYRARSWGSVLLFPLALGALLLLADHSAPHPAWVAVAALVGLALLVGWLFPVVGADLATVTVLALALWGVAFATAPPEQWAPGAGGPVNLPGDWRLTMLAAVEAGTILAFGLWLVPRTVVPHARSVLRLGPDPELAGRVQQLTRTRADAVDTAAAELRRVERDLHDGAQARLVALGMNLRAAERLIATSPEAAVALVAEARETSAKALTELRDLVRGIYPPVLADRGLGDAIRALALDTPMRVETDIDLPGRVDAPVESACYFAVAEALTNAVRHSAGRLVQVRVRFAADRPWSRPAEGRPVPGVLRIEVTDDGTGGADPARGSGLDGVERRLASFDGILALSSPPGGPTMIIMEMPCALSSAKTSTC